MGQTAEVLISGVVLSTVPINVRKGAPSLSAPVGNKLDAQTRIDVTAVAAGDTVEGNPLWFQTASGDFVWSGGCGPLQQAAVAALRTSPVSTSGLAAALSVVAPRVSSATWVDPLTAAFGQYGLSTDRRIAAAVGQFLVEAGAAFQALSENLTYTTAARLVAVYPDEFPTEADAQPYVGQPEKLANLVYANKLGNGDAASGDGFLFRGRGLIQLTGRTDYADFGATVGKRAEEAAPYCQTPEGAAMSGCWYLSSRGCLLDADAWDIASITRKVNGSAMLGAAQREAYAEAMLKQLGGS